MDEILTGNQPVLSKVEDIVAWAEDKISLRSDIIYDEVSYEGIVKDAKLALKTYATAVDDFEKAEDKLLLVGRTNQQHAATVRAVLAAEMRLKGKRAYLQGRIDMLEFLITKYGKYLND